MAVRPVDVLQRIRNQIDTAETGWDLYAEACIQGFDAAYDLHSSALTSVAKDIALQNEAIWQILGLVLGGTVNRWAGRLIAPAKSYVQKQYDELAAVWVKDTLGDVVPEVTKAVQGKVVEKFKQVAVGTSESAYAPVVEKTLIYGSRLKEGIKTRAYALKAMLDDLIAAPDAWTLPAAESLERAFKNRCPFLVDMPTDTGAEFKKNLQHDAEWEMWRAWGAARDENWWKSNSQSMEQWAMAPILRRLEVLGVSTNKVATFTRTGTTIASMRRGYRFDMLKFIEWARTSPSKTAAKALHEEEQVCRPQPSSFLKVHRPDNVCYVGGKS
jgi:hypothetical protein